MEVVFWIEKLIEKYDPERVGVDGIGIGKGVYDRLREKRYYNVDFIDVRKAGSNKEYKNLRAELYWRLRTQFIDNEINITEDDKLIQQLAGLKLKDSNDIKVIQIQSKKDMSDSPDRADSLMLSCYYNSDRLKRNKSMEKGNGGYGMSYHTEQYEGSSWLSS